MRACQDSCSPLNYQGCRACLWPYSPARAWGPKARGYFSFFFFPPASSFLFKEEEGELPVLVSGGVDLPDIPKEAPGRISPVFGNFTPATFRPSPKVVAAVRASKVSDIRNNKAPEFLSPNAPEHLGLRRSSSICNRGISDSWHAELPEFRNSVFLDLWLPGLLFLRAPVPLSIWIPVGPLKSGAPAH